MALVKVKPPEEKPEFMECPICDKQVVMNYFQQDKKKKKGPKPPKDITITKSATLLFAQCSACMAYRYRASGLWRQEEFCSIVVMEGTMLGPLLPNLAGMVAKIQGEMDRRKKVIRDCRALWRDKVGNTILETIKGVGGWECEDDEKLEKIRASLKAWILQSPTKFNYLYTNFKG